MLKAPAHVQRVLGDLAPELTAFARRRAPADLDPREVVQKVAVRALDHAEHLRDPERARAWLFRIARNTLAEEHRRSTRAPEARPIDESSDGVTADVEEPCWCILAQLQALKPEYVQILQRVVIEEQSIREVARELGITENNVTVRLHRARAALRAQLHAHCGTSAMRSCTECGCEERGCCPRPE
ncbi:MAG: sigma-70 family RNA polymerase sigma factor [Myxococcales bacterium]|nr:sigma-70 family RNA polymerase sigma factor [Myxococcales bacterium]